MEQLVWAPGAPCWAKDTLRAFAEAMVVKVDGRTATLSMLGTDGAPCEERQCSLDELLPRDVEQRCVTEMDDLRELNMATVVNNVELLFGQQQKLVPGEGPNTIYSSVGPVLIAMNPFTEMPLYDEAWVRAYHAAGGDHRAGKALGPHCYRTVEEAIARFRVVGHQSVVICGESGAGKTVTNRKMIEYICQIDETCPLASTQGRRTEPDQIAKANVLLEAFGNAKTTRNDNSSRFGKYTKLEFDATRNYKLEGCSVEHYLLERSRIVGAPVNERNYHIFYQLLRSEAASQFGLEGGPESFTYTKQGSAMLGFSDAQDFLQLCDVMEKASFGKAVQHQIFEVVAAVLHLGNIKFLGCKDVSEVDPTTEPVLKNVCLLLGIDPVGLAAAMTTTRIRLPGGVPPVEKHVGVTVGQAQRDTVAKTLYARLFDFIVAKIGEALQGGQTRGFCQQAAPQSAVLGLLDIFGFEDMMFNGFEQLFINLTNERMQHLFNTIMFERELVAYREEGIEAAFQVEESNLACVRLFTSPSGPPGIVRLLSESAMMQSGRDDAAFVQVLNNTFANYPSYKVCDPQAAQRTARAKGMTRAGGREGASLDYRRCFQVRHYAGTVMYTVKGWVPKSIDTLLPHLSEVLVSSTKTHVQCLFEREESNMRATVGEKFCTQLESLAATLEQGETSFIRCIKSNPQMVPGIVNRPLVLEQLLHGGVISALEQRHRGLPERVAYSDFCQEYRGLGSSHAQNSGDKLHCQAQLRSIFGIEAEEGNQFAFGHTKVFMKNHILACLRAIVSLRSQNMAKRLQRRWRLKMGTERIRRVEEAWAKFKLTEQAARNRDIASLPTVARALEDTQQRLGALMQVLAEARHAHGDDVRKIADMLPNELVKQLYGIVESLDIVVDRVSQRKKTAEELLGVRITRAMNIVLGLLDRVAAVVAECQEVADIISNEEREQCLGACATAQTKLQALQATDLPALRQRGPVGADLESTEEEAPLAEADLCPGLGELLEQATQILMVAEEAGHSILAVRRAFRKALVEVQGRQEAALEALEALHEHAQRCVAEGLDGIVETVNVAWQRQADAQEILQMAKDADGYRAAVDAFVTAVSEAEATVERGRTELAQREAEKIERLSLQAELDAMQQKLVEKKSGIQKTVDMVCLTENEDVSAFAFAVENLLQAIVSLRGGALGGTLADWRADIHDISEHMKFVVHAIDTQLMHATKANQEEFIRRLHAFNHGAGAKQCTGEHATPAVFLQSEGLSAHKESFKEILQIIFHLQKAGATRSAVHRCLNHWVKSVWSGEYDESVCTSWQPKDEPATTKIDIARESATHVEPQRAEPGIAQQQHHGQSNEGIVSSQECAVKQAPEMSSTNGCVSSKAMVLNAAPSLPKRLTTPWQVLEGPVLRSVARATNCETSYAVSKPQLRKEPSDLRRECSDLKTEPSDLTQSTRLPPSVSLQQMLNSRPRHAKIRVDGCLCRFALLLIGFASGWMSSTLPMHDARGWSATSCPSALINGEVDRRIFNFCSNGRMRKPRIAYQRSKRRRP